MAEQKKEAKKGSPVVRLLIILALLLVIAAAVRFIFLKMELRRGADLYGEDKYEAAIELLEPVSHSMLAGLGLRAPAERIIGLSKAEIASRIALEERSIEGYNKALEMLDEAQRLAGLSKDIQDRIDEYTDSRDKLLKSEEARQATETEAPTPLPEGAGTDGGIGGQ